MASRQKRSAFLLRGDELVQCLSGSGKWQAAVVSEPSSFLVFIAAKHLCPRLSAPPRAQPGLQRTGWLGNPTVAKPRAVASLLALPPRGECPGPHAVVPDMGCDSCCSCISLHSAELG